MKIYSWKGRSEACDPGLHNVEIIYEQGRVPRFGYKRLNRSPADA
jgi:hypothetical protein